jgi:IclR family KDG regulon transcriptional repressor
MSTNHNYIVKPVDKALQVLTLLADVGRELSLKEICMRTGLPKTTAFRYLYTLSIGQSAGQFARLLDVALPHMQELRDRFDETVNLGVLNHTDIIYLGMVESRRALRMQAILGGRDPAYSTSLGKAILSALPEEQRAAHLPARLIPRTNATLVAPEALRLDLELSRQRGYAVDQGENEDGSCCIGAPIFDRHRHAIAATASRLPPEMTERVAQAVMQAAAAISQQLEA